MLQIIKDRLYLTWNNPNYIIKIGLIYQLGEAYPHDVETGITDFEAEPKDIHCMILGIGFFNIEIFW